MDLPSFIWLWKIAAWSMGLALFAYFVLAVSGISMAYIRISGRERIGLLRPLHYGIGFIMVGLVAILLAIGVIGTLGEYGNLGHSPHLIGGISVVILVIISALSGWRIGPRNPRSRALHIGTNLLLLLGYLFAGLTGWTVVQKYLP